MNGKHCFEGRRSRSAAVIASTLLVLITAGFVLEGVGPRVDALTRRDEGGYEYEDKESGTDTSNNSGSSGSTTTSSHSSFTIYGQPTSEGGDYGPEASGAWAYRPIGPCHRDGPNEFLSLPASEITRLQDVVRTNGTALVVIFSSDEKHAVRMTIQAANLLPGTTTVGIASSTGNEKWIQGCNSSSGLTSKQVTTWSQAKYMYLSRPSGPGAPGEDSLVMRSRDYFVWWTTGFPDIFSWDPDTFWGLVGGNMVTFDWIRD